MKKVSRIEYCASFEPLQSGMGQDGESKILFLPDIPHHTNYTKASTKMGALHKTSGLPAQQPSSEMYKMQFQEISLEGTSY